METDRSLDTMEVSIGWPIVERVADDTPVETAPLATLHWEWLGHHAQFERPFADKLSSLHRRFTDSFHERAIEREEPVPRERSALQGDPSP